MYDVIVSEASVDDAIVPTAVAHLSAIPSTIDLAGAEIELVSQFSRETRLKKALATVREGAYDFILLDCPPSLGLLTINALTAAEELIVPIQCEYYALEGLGQLLRNVSLVQQNINPGLRLSGIVMTMFDPRTKLSEQVVEEVRRYFGELVYDVIIPRTVRLSEAPGFGQPITVYDPKSKGAASYRELGREVAPGRRRPSRCRPSTTSRRSSCRRSTPLPRPPSRSGRRSSARFRWCTISRKPSRRPEPAEPVPEPSQPRAGPRAGTRTKPEPNRSRNANRSRSRSQREPESKRPNRSRNPNRIRSPSPSRPRTAPTPKPLPPAAPTSALDDEDVWEEADAATRASSVAPPSSPAPPGHLPERRVVVIDEDAEPVGALAAERSRSRGSAVGRPRGGRHRRHPRGRPLTQAPMATVPKERRVMSKRGGLGGVCPR